MADYSSTGMWNRHGLMVEIPDMIKLTSFETARDIINWQHKYELNDDYLPESTRNQPLFDIDAFCKEGHQLAANIQKLYPNLEVWYFDERCDDNGFMIGLVKV